MAAFFLPACYQPPMSLRAEELACRRGGREVFAGVSFALRPGDALLLEGPNGSGKSSLLRILALLSPARAGRLLWLDRPIDGAREEYRESFLFVGHHDGVKGALTVRENLLFAIAMLRAGGEPRHLGNALERFGLAAIAERPGRYLSAGQKRRLALARLAAIDAPLWLLDEPTAALDREGRAALEDLIGAYRARGGVVVASSHGALSLDNAQRLDMADFPPQRMVA